MEEIKDFLIYQLKDELQGASEYFNAINLTEDKDLKDALKQAAIQEIGHATIWFKWLSKNIGKEELEKELGGLKEEKEEEEDKPLEEDNKEEEKEPLKEDKEEEKKEEE